MRQPAGIRFFFLSGLLVALVTGSGACRESGSTSTAAGGFVLAPEGAGFSIRFPAEPEVDHRDVESPYGPVRFEMRLRPLPNGQVFSLGWADYPEKLLQDVKPETPFVKAREDMLATTRGELKEERSLTVAGQPASDLTIAGTGPNGPAVFRIRTIQVGDRLYQLMHSCPAAHDDPAPARSFFESLELSIK